MKKRTKTLREDDIETRRADSPSALTLMQLGIVQAAAQSVTSDSDGGRWADPGGRGRFL